MTCSPPHQCFLIVRGQNKTNLSSLSWGYTQVFISCVPFLPLICWIGASASAATLQDRYMWKKGFLGHVMGFFYYSSSCQHKAGSMKGLEGLTGDRNKVAAAQPNLQHKLFVILMWITKRQWGRGWARLGKWNDIAEGRFSWSIWEHSAHHI